MLNSSSNLGLPTSRLIMEKNKESCNPCYTVAKHLINLYLLFCGRLTMQTETVVLGEMKGRIWNIVLYS